MNNLLTITQASKMIEPSISTLRRDIKRGKVSAIVDERGKTYIDPSELSRVYKVINNDIDASESASETSDERSDVRLIVVLEAQIDDLREQNKALREQVADERAERSKVIALAEKQLQALQPPPKPKRTLSDLLSFFKTPNPTKGEPLK